MIQIGAPDEQWRASMPNASEVNLARVLAYIVASRYSPLLYYLVFSIKNLTIDLPKKMPMHVTKNYTI